MSYLVGIDIGGTFTDTFVTDGSAAWRGKAPTTPHALIDGLLASLDAAAADVGAPLESILSKADRFSVGTTVVTNTLTELSGAPTGVVLTRGFGDLLRMARGHRRGVDGMSLPLPEIVPRSAVEEVNERVDSQGRVLVPIEDDDVARAVRRLVEEEQIEALAVCLLWSFRNPRHEARVATIARALYPRLFVTTSNEVFPVIREYERLMTTVLNAYSWRAFSTFIDEVEGALRGRGLTAPISVMQSNGGTLSHAEARGKPIFLAQSGPVAGVAAARRLGREMGLPDVITGDMGGTSFDVSLIVGGEALHRVRAELFGFWTGMVMVDVSSIGAGGGSIGWIDERELLRVGPRSAGAVPGPACYGKGGSDATLTDALVVLGLLDPSYFLGGTVPLDAEAAAGAIDRVAERLNLTRAAAAAGVYRLGLEEMRGAMKALLIEKGLDPRRFAFMSYGGCAGLFAAPLAFDLGIPTVIVPRLASVFSACGAATADVRMDVSRTVFRPMPVSSQVLGEAFESLSEEVRDRIAAQGVADERIEIFWEADLRFRRQQWEVTVPVPVGLPTEEIVRRLHEDFLSRYQSLYGPGAAKIAAGVDLVNCRAVGFGRAGDHNGRAGGGRRSPAASRPGPKGQRIVPYEFQVVDGGRVADSGGERLSFDVYDGEGLLPGARLDGRALIERRDTTIYVPAGACAEIDAQGSCVLTRVTRKGSGAS